MTAADLLDELVAQVEREPQLTSIPALQARAYVLTGRREELAALLLRLAIRDAYGNHAHTAQMEAEEVLTVLDGYRRTGMDVDRLRELWTAVRNDVREGHELRRAAIDDALNHIIGDAIPAALEVAS